MKKNIIKFSLDIVLAITFILIFNLGATGIAFHEIASIALGIIMIVHVLLNWSWVVGITKKIFSRNIPGKTKFSYVMNILLLVNMAIVMISGLLISEVLLPNFRYFTNINWLPIHLVSAITTLTIVGIHVGLHWSWVKQIGEKFPRLHQLFTFRRAKVFARVFLVIGTLAFAVQVPKAVIMTPAMFSDQTFQKGHEEGRGGEAQAGTPNGKTGEFESKEENGEFQGEGHEGGESSILLRTIMAVPIIIIYLALIGSLAFYTHKVENRVYKKKKKVALQ